MSSNPLLSLGKSDEPSKTPSRSYDFRALEEFFSETLEPESMSVFLEEVEEQYISFLLKYPEVPGQTAEHQVYYLRKLRKAFQKILSAVSPKKPDNQAF